jgi:uncharacterized protein Smg (DUF494 family)
MGRTDLDYFGPEYRQMQAVKSIGFLKILESLGNMDLSGRTLVIRIVLQLDSQAHSKLVRRGAGSRSLCPVL